MTDKSCRATVSFCMQWMPSYRAPLYEQLQERLAQDHIHMQVIHGMPPPSRSQRRDHVEPPWGVPVENRVATVRGTELTWQPVWKLAKDSDLIIVQLEAALAFNYLALIHRRLGGPKVAFWGHGENFNPLDVNSVAEGLKRRTAPLADWFFAYTERSASVAEGLSVDPARITVTNNSRSADNEAAADASPEIAQLCVDVRARTSNVGWMVSALGAWKRVDHLIEILDEVRSLVPDFEFFLLGSGEEEHVSFEAAATRPWLHVVGARFDGDKVAIGEIASVMIHPGLIGLHVIDAFAFETPIVTSEFECHSHEFDYLENDVNAIVLAPAATALETAKAVESIFNDESRRAGLVRGCRESAERYSLTHTIERFAYGIAQALAT